MTPLNTLLASCLLSVVHPAVAQSSTSSNALNDTSPSVTISSGPLIGRETQYPGSDSTVHQYLGIPFAQPPVDDLRFSPAQEVEAWDSPYNATSQAPACLQSFGPPGQARSHLELIFNTPPPEDESEDCLYLNVYTPATGSDGKPVLFWIFGGAGLFGSAALPLYDGTSFAANHDIVVVAPNYRTNLFGNPSTSMLPLDARNLARLDIRLALEWTQKNIEVFGGDPDKVTIAGESEGAVAVGELINTYPNEPPFRGAILQSGSGLAVPTLPGFGQELWDDLVELVNCTESSDEDILSCMRDVPAQALQETISTNNLVFNKKYEDNITILENKGAAWATGNVAKVPILIGSTADEGSMSRRDEDVGDFFNTVFAGEPEAAEAFEALYSPDSPATAGRSNNTEILAQIETDFLYRCTSGFVANATSNILDVPVWQYTFDAQVPSNTIEEMPWLGVYHSSEIMFIFGTLQENASEIDRKLSQSMQKQWADFVKHPSRGPGWEQWPKMAVLGINDTDATTTVVEVSQMDAVCAEWDLVYCIMVPEVCGGAIMSVNDTSADGSAEGEEAETSSAQHMLSMNLWAPAGGLLALAALL